MSTSLRSIEAILLLDNDGKRIVAKYYGDEYVTVAEQLEFEKKLHKMTDNMTTEIMTFNGMTILYRANVDLVFYVVGSEYENELLLKNVLSTFYDAVSIILRHEVEKRSVHEHIGSVFLVVDELVDNGIIMESDGALLASRCVMGSGGSGNSEEVSLAEQSLAQAFQSARNQLVTSFLK